VVKLSLPAPSRMGIVRDGSRCLSRAMIGRLAKRAALQPHLDSDPDYRPEAMGATDWPAARAEDEARVRPASRSWIIRMLTEDRHHNFRLLSGKTKAERLPVELVEDGTRAGGGMIVVWLGPAFSSAEER